MHHVPLESSNAADWNCVASQSDDAWFWHTTPWLEFVKAVGAAYFIEDLSFIIAEDRQIVAICPVILEKRGCYRCFTYLGEVIPFPAFGPAVSAALRLKTLQYYAETLDQMAATHDVGYTRVAVPSLARASTDKCTWNALLRHGYLDASNATQLVYLSEGEEVLWNSVRKGHRADIKRAAKSCEIKFWDCKTITPEKFSEYQVLHARDAGRITRSQVTFEMMHRWIREDLAVLVEACHAGQSVAFGLLILFRKRAYYGSACRDPEQMGIPAMHLILWESMRWLIARGYEYYDLGIQYFGPRWHYVPNTKDISIASFKRGFGGTTHRLDTVERFYAADILENVAAERIRALVKYQRKQR